MLTLCFPRLLTRGLGEFTPWDDLPEFLAEVNSRMKWVPRHEIERSADLVQPIPCGVFQDSSNNFLVLRRTPSHRHDLSTRLSLVVGGHVAPPDVEGSFPPLENLLLLGFRREVLEELTVSIRSFSPLGLVVDHSSLAASRHLGFVYRAFAEREVKVIEAKEYSQVGRFLPTSHLQMLADQLDPWSSILLRNVFAAQQ
jgi:predicted NUDIX family phosphoesterase